MNKKEIYSIHNKTEYNTEEKLRILSDAAKYDVACTSSGVSRSGKEGYLGNSVSAGICHSFAADGRCISLLKVLMTNECIYDCKYCKNRVSNDVERAMFEPEELCNLTMEFYRRNYIEGLFLSSGVVRNPAYTMEKMCEILYLLREKHRFNGYIHIKTIPGAPDSLLELAGLLADRISINMELPTPEGLKKLAPNKDFKTILNPMGKVAGTIASHRSAIGKDARMERSSINRLLPNSIFHESNNRLGAAGAIPKKEVHGLLSQGVIRSNNVPSLPAVSEAHDNNAGSSMEDKLDYYSPFLKNVDHLSLQVNGKRTFAPAGQSTQMIIGATDETDLMILQTTQKLYQNYDLKRVFFSAYIPLNDDPALPAMDMQVPLLREHRLYQADWLLRYYGFLANEILSEDKPFLEEKIDPKCDWAIRHLERFPLELQTASFDELLRVPGIGPKSAVRIMEARRYGRLTYENLKKMGVVLKRAHYFVLCNGKMMYPTRIEKDYILERLTQDNTKENWQISHQQESYRQMTIFDFLQTKQN